MGNVNTVLIDDDARALTCRILTEHLPEAVEVYVFGSRAGGRPRRVSDLDILLDAKRPISPEVILDLKEAFDESDLPWKVDLIDRQAISERFFGAIKGDLLPLLET